MKQYKNTTLFTQTITSIKNHLCIKKEKICIMKNFKTKFEKQTKLCK